MTLEPRRRRRRAFGASLALSAVLLLAPASWLARIVPAQFAPIPATESQWLANADKLGHLVLFLILGWLGLAAYRRPDRTELYAGAPVLVGLIAYGAVIETIQSFVPGRGAEFLDLVADALGVAFAAMLWWLRSRIVRLEG